MKFTIEVETDEDNSIINATVFAVTPVNEGIESIPVKGIKLKKASINPPGDSWLVLDEITKKRMIVLSQLTYRLE